MESTLVEGSYIGIRENKPRGHKKGQGKRAEQESFNGFTVAEVLKLGKKKPHTLTRNERQALEVYWDARLVAMGESISKGYDPGWLTYEADVGVLDFFAHDGEFFVPENEETEESEPVSLIRTSAQLINNWIYR